MVKYNVVCLVALALVASGVDAFVATSSRVAQHASSTSLNALPTMIIGPMIRKMREEKAKKKMPMASPSEAANEAPGLRVGPGAWKWPAIWPYDDSFFIPKEDAPSITPDIKSMAGLLTGTPPVPEVPVAEDNPNKLDPIKYWGEEKADVTTDLDEDSAANLRRHYGFYLKDGMSVLELGAAEESYLPEGLKLSRHVGVGANKKLMDQNPALTENLVVNLNNVTADQDVNSEELRRLALEEPFDAIIMANTIDFLTNPREVYRTAWNLLKPGGIMMNAFSTKEAYSNKFGRAQVRMWTDYNDDQHMWVSGSFFQFSAGDGWETIKGFDISPETAKDAYDTSPLKFFEKGKANNIYVVQARKASVAEAIDENDPEKSFKSLMWMLPTMEERDKVLVASRMKRAYEVARNDAERNALAANVQYLPKIYEGLIRMDSFAFGFGLQSQLAVDLIADPDFNGNEEQIRALKEGLGLRTPSEEFWVPVGQNTASMTAEDKINLLSYIVPRFGSGNPEQDAALKDFVTGMKPTFSAIRTKCPGLSEEDVQLLGTEFLAAEVLIPGRSTKEEFAAWVGQMTEAEMLNVLQERKQFKIEALKELEEYKTERDAKIAEEEEFRRKLREQVAEARRQRTTVFNTRTGKFEVMKK